MGNDKKTVFFKCIHILIQEIGDIQQVLDKSREK